MLDRLTHQVHHVPADLEPIVLEVDLVDDPAEEVAKRGGLPVVDLESAVGSRLDQLHDRRPGTMHDRHLPLVALHLVPDHHDLDDLVRHLSRWAAEVGAVVGDGTVGFLIGRTFEFYDGLVGHALSFTNLNLTFDLPFVEPVNLLESASKMGLSTGLWIPRQDRSGQSRLSSIL